MKRINVQIKGIPNIKQNKLSLDVDDNKRVGELITDLGIENSSGFIFIVNNNKVSNEYIINNNDEIIIFPRIAGG